MFAIIDKYQPQAIYATAPPFGTATIVAQISEEFNKGEKHSLKG